MRNADAPPRARIQAADILLDRGWAARSVNNLIDSAALVPVTSSARPSNLGDTLSSGLRRNNAR
jgi:hypothetical protein